MITCSDGQAVFTGWAIVAYLIGYLITCAILTVCFADEDELEFSIFVFGLLSIIWPFVIPALLAGLAGIFIRSLVAK